MKKSPVLFYSEGTCALASLITLLWLDQPFRLCRIEESDSESDAGREYLKLNGLGEVPTLFLDGTVLTENIAILQHLAQLDLSKQLTFPVGTREFDQLNRALGFLTSTFHKSFLPLFATEQFHPDEKIQQEIRDTVLKGHLREVFRYTSEHLLRTTLMFEQPSIGDAYLFAMARWGAYFGNVHEEFPHFVRFQKRMEQDPAVQIALRIEKGEIKDAAGNFLGHVPFESFVHEAVHRKLEVDGARAEGEYTPDPDLATGLRHFDRKNPAAEVKLRA
jgi:glutathione S-transferase